MWRIYLSEKNTPSYRAPNQFEDILNFGLSILISKYVKKNWKRISISG
uniref:Uncharacterized protein n=1 Tax=Arundo donax TaxID=35708 RepID=A0A0A8ZPU4_ARUDO